MMNPYTVNEEIVQTLHAKKLRKFRKRPLARPDTYLKRMLFAIRRLPFRIDTATNEEIRDYIESLSLKDCTRFEVVRALNEVLKYLGRPGLANPRPEFPEIVEHITVPDFLTKIQRLPEQYQLVAAALFATGCRFGELPLVRIDGDWAYIGQQVRDDGRLWRTKNGVRRHAAVLPTLKPFVEAYLRLPEKVRVELRVKHYNRLYGAFTRELDINIHGLRHSYAIECAKAGKSVEEVASWLGDTVEVSKKHYIGYLRPTKNPWG